MKLKVVMISHNQLELIQKGIKALKLFGGITDQDIIIVDNASEDGLAQWLSEQGKWNYLVCDEGIENYATIMNTVIREFEIQEDVFILTPYYVVLPGMLQDLYEVLHSDAKIGAVFPTLIANGGECAVDYAEALAYAAAQQDKRKRNRQLLAAHIDAVLLKAEMLCKVGMFDERLARASSGILDFLLRGGLQGYRYIECANAYIFGIDEWKINERWSTPEDQPALKEKWGMNYFNVIPNENLLDFIKADEQEPIQVLEIGCDIGANLLEVKNRYPNAGIYGVEIVPQAARIASCVADVQVANIEEDEVSFHGVKFDYIVCGDVLEHLRDPEGLVRRCRDLLKEGGGIVASIPNIMHYSVMRQLLDGNFSYRDAGLLDRTHIHFFTYKEIVRMFGRADYVIESVKTTEERGTTENDHALVEQLMELSRGVEKEMFYAFQYLVLARKK